MSSEERKIEIIRKLTYIQDEAKLDAIEHLLSEPESNLPKPIIRLLEKAMTEEPLEKYTSVRAVIRKKS
tara:strand:+ start:80 stop:286 length:207 start_codon:yes stop_codon:yes gene_type:complete